MRQLSTLRLVGVTVLFMCVSAFCAADTFTDSVNFLGGNRSMWGPTNASVYDANFFWGQSWNVPITTLFDGTGCDPVFGDCYGGAVWAGTSGKVGFQLDVHSDNGSVTAEDAAAITLNAGNPVNGLVHVTSSANINKLASGGTFVSHFPNASVNGSLVLQAHAYIGGEGCFVECWSGTSGDLLGLNIDQSIFSYNQNDDGALRLFGFTVPYAPGHLTDIKNPPFGSPVAPVLGHFEYTEPNINLTGAPYQVVVGTYDLGLTQAQKDANTNATLSCEFNPFCTSPVLPYPVPPNCDSLGNCTQYAPGNGLTATGTGSMLTVTADALNMGLSAAGLPPVSWSFGIPGCGACPSLDASALQINIGPTIGLNQTITLSDPTQVAIDLHVEETNKDYLITAGQAIDIPTDGFDGLHIDPTYTLLGSQLSNSTSLALGLTGGINGLCISAFGFASACAINDTWSSGDASIGPPVFDRNWAFSYDPVAGTELVVGTPPSDVPEPATLVLFGTGLAGIAKQLHRRRKSQRC